MHNLHQKSQMEYKEPKTRQEAKGRTDKKSKDNLYTQKRVRQIEAIMERKKLKPSHSPIEGNPLKK